MPTRDPSRADIRVAQRSESLGDPSRSEIRVAERQDFRLVAAWLRGFECRRRPPRWGRIATGPAPLGRSTRADAVTRCEEEEMRPRGIRVTAIRTGSDSAGNDSDDDSGAAGPGPRGHAAGLRGALPHRRHAPPSAGPGSSGPEMRATAARPGPSTPSWGLQGRGNHRCGFNTA